MIAVYARRSDTQAAEACCDLRKKGIPCILVGPEYGFTSVIERVPFVFIGSGCEDLIQGFRGTIPTIKRISDYALLTADSLMDRFLTVYGMDYNNFTRGGIRFEGDRCYFFGNRIYLTAHEELIVRHLALCGGNFFTAEEIAEFTLSGTPQSTTVHICNINRKNRASVTEKIIYSKRYRGYYVK